MFDKHWFDEHQKTLLTLVNTLPIRRSLMIPAKNRIVKLTPNSCTELIEGRKYKASIYSNNQFAQLLKKNYRNVWEMAHWFDMKFANKFMPAWNLGFDSYSSQPDETTGIDSYMAQDSATTNFGTNTTLIIGEDTGAASARKNGLIKFDISSIPSNATLDTNGSVFTIKTSAAASETNNSNVSMYQLLRDWIETEATWNIWKTSNNWTTAGAGGDGTDADLTNSWGSYSIANTEAANVTKTITINTTGLAVFQTMVAGSVANYGWTFKSDVLNCSHSYYSSGAVTAGNRPKLDVTYTASGSSGFFM